MNQLKTVTRNGVTTEYSYQNGNIVSVTQNGEAVKSYTYGNSAWKDLLTAYNGQTITYDQIGNPLTYRGKTMTWQNGRQLAGITDGETAISYAYDMDGNRVSKTVNGVTTNYVVLDGALAGEITGGNKLAFLYDESGTKYGLVYNDTTYFYNLNLQGDVVGIYDSTGAEVVTYIYDEWGKLLSCTGALASTVGQINPIRYRGYYYDAETGFYATGTRYYDPEVGRFINADVQLNPDILGNNLFAYCSNNSVCRSDSTGLWFGFDDVITGPVDEIIVVVGLGILSLFGVGWASGALDDIGQAVSDAWTGFAEFVDGYMADYQLAKSSKQSDKARSTDKPSWVNKGMVDNGLSAEENARRLLNDKYGKGGWNTGPGSEFNKIKKWLTRDIGLKSFIISDDYSEYDVFMFDGDLYITDPSNPSYVWINGVRTCLLC